VSPKSVSSSDSDTLTKVSVSGLSTGAGLHYGSERESVESCILRGFLKGQRGSALPYAAYFSLADDENFRGAIRKLCNFSRTDLSY
jgi:hypothetical protein